MSEEQSLLDQWNQADTPAETITVEQMDQLVQELRAAKTEYDAANEHAESLKGAYEELRKKMLGALKTLKRDNYSVDGHGLAYIARKEVYTVPKTNEDKTALFNYIKGKYGGDALMSMVGIHSQTLTSWANKETETGEVQSIPGLEQPTMIETLNFRKR